MTTPEGTPTGRDTVQHKAFDPGDAAVQANAQGGGMYTGSGEKPKVLGSNQDKSATGAADGTSGLSSQKGRANK